MPEAPEHTGALDETARLDVPVGGRDDAPPAEDAPARRSPVPLIALLVACALVAGVMLLGEGTLWEAAPAPGSEASDVTSGQVVEEVPDADTSGDDGEPGDAAAGSGYSDELLSTYEVAATSSHDAAWGANVRLAANALNGSVIPAGEALSFNEAIGETTQERGYQEAAVMSGNVATTVVGGGVSQVSTALYVAALYAGLDVEERHPNVVAVDYAAMGLDAAVSSDGQDLVVRNDTSYPVRVEAATAGTTVTVSLFGVPKETNVKRDVTSRVADMYARPASEVYDDPAAQGLLPTDSVRFYVAEVYVATYRDDQQESNRLVSSDTYQVVGEQATTYKS